MVTNSTGTFVDESDYYPFGGERIITNSDPNPYKFTGKERDGESGLDYFIARHYASNLGRFVQPDEFAGGPVDAFSSNDPLPDSPLPYADITNPQSLNKYTYTYNNPLRYTDADGHETLKGPSDPAWPAKRDMKSTEFDRKMSGAIILGSSALFGVAGGVGRIVTGVEIAETATTTSGGKAAVWSITTGLTQTAAGVTTGAAALADSARDELEQAATGLKLVSGDLLTVVTETLSTIVQPPSPPPPPPPPPPPVRSSPPGESPEQDDSSGRQEP